MFQSLGHRTRSPPPVAPQARQVGPEYFLPELRADVGHGEIPMDGMAGPAGVLPLQGMRSLPDLPGGGMASVARFFRFLPVRVVSVNLVAGAAPPLRLPVAIEQRSFPDGMALPARRFTRLVRVGGWQEMQSADPCFPPFPGWHSEQISAFRRFPDHPDLGPPQEFPDTPPHRHDAASVDIVARRAGDHPRSGRFSIGADPGEPVRQRSGRHDVRRMSPGGSTRPQPLPFPGKVAGSAGFFPSLAGSPRRSPHPWGLSAVGSVARLAYAVPGDPPQIVRGEDDRVLRPVASGAENTVGPVRLSHPLFAFPAAVGRHGTSGRSRRRMEISGRAGRTAAVRRSLLAFATSVPFLVLRSPRMAPPAQGPPRIAVGNFPPVNGVAFEALDDGSRRGSSMGFPSIPRVAPEAALRLLRPRGKQRGLLHRGVHLMACAADDLPGRSHHEAFFPDRLRQSPLRYLLEDGMRERDPPLFPDRVLGIVAFEAGVGFGRPEKRRPRRRFVDPVAATADLPSVGGADRHVRPGGPPLLDVRRPTGRVTFSARPFRPDLLSTEGTPPIPRLRMERVACGARFFTRMGHHSRDRVSLAETMTGDAYVDGPSRSFPASMDRMALQAAGKGLVAALPGPPALERMASGPGRIDRRMATAAKDVSRIPKEGFPGSAVGHVTIRASRIPDAPCVESSWFRRMVRMASGADGVTSFTQGNARPCENSPPPFYVRGVACGARSTSPFPRRQGGVLRPPPKDRTAVLYGSVVATVAEPLLVERFLLLGREKGGIEKNAFPDVAEGTVLLVEGGTGINGSFEKERQQQREREESLLQQTHDPMVRGRSPS